MELHPEARMIETHNTLTKDVLPKIRALKDDPAAAALALAIVGPALVIGIIGNSVNFISRRPADVAKLTLSVIKHIASVDISKIRN